MHWVGYDQVYKQGSISQDINVNHLSNYEGLRVTIAFLFNLMDILDPDLGWELMYENNEEEVSLVGDDPWEYVTSLF
jgi:hypothetical protein